MTESIRVLVVDDSAFMRKVMRDLLESEPGIVVIDTARDGLDALQKAAVLKPDVITLDIEMPKLDGLAALQRLMTENPLPVVMVSSLTQNGAEATMKALALGAVDFVPKPSGSVSLDLARVRDELIRKVKAAAKVVPQRLGVAGWRRQVNMRSSVTPAARSPVSPKRPAPRPVGQALRLSHLVIVATSTGGPSALHRFFSTLEDPFPSGVVVVQHMPPGFTQSLASHLDKVSPLHVREAEEGDRLLDGLALVAPGGRHLEVRRNGLVALHDEPPRHGVRPAADVTLESIPDELAARCVVVILTGMGLDGARGARYLRERGAEVWAQDEESAVVYGMPRAAAELGIVTRVGPPEQLATWLNERLRESNEGELAHDRPRGS